MSTLEVVLNLSRKAKASDPRDKICGILGLLPSLAALGIFPKYSLSQEEVFFQFARTLLEESRRLEAIFSWCSFKENSSLSSWIPDWTTQFTRNHIRWLRKRKAASIVATEWSISEGNRYLHCRGLIFDSVESLSASLPETLTILDRGPKTTPSYTQLCFSKPLWRSKWVTCRTLESITPRSPFQTRSSENVLQYSLDQLERTAK
jgi:hypothetical protein